MSDQWETFCDVGYYHMWRLRLKTERGWNDGFHINTRDEAEGLCELLNKLEREVAEAKEQCSNLDDQISSAMMVIRGMKQERDAALIGYNECRATIEDARRALGATAYEGPLLAAMRVTEQRDRMQHEREFFQSAFIEQGDVLCKVIEQRDKALCELEMWQDGNIMHESHRNEIQGLEQQRDTLAEALRTLMFNSLRYRMESYDASYQEAEAALAAVKGGSDE